MLVKWLQLRYIGFLGNGYFQAVSWLGMLEIPPWKQSTTFILFDSIFIGFLYFYLFLGLQPKNGLILWEPPRPEDL